MWTAAGLVDTILSEESLFFELDRAEIADGRVTPPRIVEAFDGIEHIGLPHHVSGRFCARSSRSS